MAHTQGTIGSNRRLGRHRLGRHRLGHHRLGHHRLGHHRLGHHRLGQLATIADADANANATGPHLDACCARIVIALGSPWNPGTTAFTGSTPVASSSVDVAAAAFGQGRVLVSPLAMAEVAATVAIGAVGCPHHHHR
ncbi:MAG: hypothetical protein ACYCS7_05070 [Acidimicrobiales bacterium]